MPPMPRGMRRVRAASGPYAAELSASRPKMGMPAAGPMCSARSSDVARGRPNSRSVICMRVLRITDRTETQKLGVCEFAWSCAGGCLRSELQAKWLWCEMPHKEMRHEAVGFFRLGKIGVVPEGVRKAFEDDELRVVIAGAQKSAVEDGGAAEKNIASARDE